MCGCHAVTRILVACSSISSLRYSVIRWFSPCVPYRANAGIDEFRRIGVLKDLRSTLLRKLRQEIISLIGDSTSTPQTADNLPFIVSNRKFIERAHRACDEQYDVAGSHQNDIASLQTKAGVDD